LLTKHQYSCLCALVTCCPFCMSHILMLVIYILIYCAQCVFQVTRMYPAFEACAVSLLFRSEYLSPVSSQENREVQIHIAHVCRISHADNLWRSNSCSNQLGRHAHFQGFGMSLFTLFRISTSDAWGGVQLLISSFAVWMLPQLSAYPYQ
jgi:hypothetical protein